MFVAIWKIPKPEQECIHRLDDITQKKRKVPCFIIVVTVFVKSLLVDRKEAKRSEANRLFTGPLQSGTLQS
jgi:hypothetical protein